MSALAPAAGRQGPGALSPDALARLQLGALRRAGGPLPGEHRAPGLGAGTELAQLRPYEPGDDVRWIDAAATARTSVPHVRLHVPERSVTTWIVLDVSPSMAFGTADRLKSDVAEGVVAAVGSLAVRHGGRVAFTTAGAPRDVSLPARSGRGALAAVRRLAASGVAPDGGAAASSLGEAIERVLRLARTAGVVVVISDFRDDGWAAALKHAGVRHTVLAVEVADPREAELPDAGEVPFVDPETGDEAWVDTSSPAVRSAFAQAEAERREALAATLRSAGATHVALSTGDDWLRELGRTLR